MPTGLLLAQHFTSLTFTVYVDFKKLYPDLDTVHYNTASALITNSHTSPKICNQLDKHLYYMWVYPVCGCQQCMSALEETLTINC